jgi:hypothetical protein
MAMLSHPDAIGELALIRHQELQAECTRYRRAAQAVPAPRGGMRFARTRARFTALTGHLRARLRELTDPEKLLDAFSRSDSPLPM